MDLKKKIVISLISFWGIGIILALVFVSILALQRNLTISRVQASPGSSCNVNDNLKVNSGLESQFITGDSYIFLQPVANDYGRIGFYDTSSGFLDLVLQDGGGNVGIGTTSPGYKLDVNGTVNMTGFRMPTGVAAGRVLTSDASGVGTWQPVPGGGGDITGVIAGAGLTGGGLSGDVTLTADTTYLQRRVTGSCLIGSAIRIVNADGTVTCEPVGGAAGLWTDQGTYIYPNNYVTFAITDTGYLGVGTTTPDSAYKITTSGGGIKAENASATNPAGYFSSTGGGYAIQTGTGGILFANLAGVGTRMMVANASGVLSTQAIPTGDITGVIAGVGLTGGGLSSDVTLTADTTYLQRRVTGSCLIGNAIRIVNADGTVTCEPVGGAAVNYWTQSGSNLYPNNTAWNVGIGTTSPGAKLDVAGDIILGGAGEKFILHPRTGIGDFFQITNQNAGSDWLWGQGITLRDTGNVGIGITNPGYKLDISNTTGAGGLQVNTNYSAFINRGIYSIASGGTSQNYGGQFSGSNGSFNFGIFSSASGPADSVNYALYSSASGGSTNWGLYVAAGNAYFAGNVGIGIDPGTNKLKVAGNTEITGNLTVTGKTNISYPLNPWQTVDCTTFSAANNTCNFTPDTNYSAVMIGIAADVESDTLAIGFFDAAGGGGNEIGRLYMGSAVCEAAFGSFYRPAHSTVLLPTSVKSAKILSIGGCTRGTNLTNNIIIMGYFK